jgi:hypothetical protein
VALVAAAAADEVSATARLSAGAPASSILTGVDVLDDRSPRNVNVKRRLSRGLCSSDRLGVVDFIDRFRPKFMGKT